MRSGRAWGTDDVAVERWLNEGGHPAAPAVLQREAVFVHPSSRSES